MRLSLNDVATLHHTLKYLSLVKIGNSFDTHSAPGPALLSIDQRVKRMIVYPKLPEPPSHRCDQ